MHDGLSGFLWQVGSSTRLLKLYALQKSFTWGSLTSALKSPIMMLFSYWEEYKPKFLLSTLMCLEMLFLKYTNAYLKISLSLFFWKSSLTYNKIPPPWTFRLTIRKGLLKPLIKNWLLGKLSSIFVSEIVSSLFLH